MEDAPRTPTVTEMPPVTFEALPTELLLQIIPQIPYTSRDLRSLSQTNRRLRTVMRTHEASLVRRITAQQFTAHSTLALFPSLKMQSYPALATLQTRLSTLAALHTQWLHITSHGPDLHWLRGRWEGVHRAGLLLLYRLQDVGGHCQKVALLNQLPATSLACLAFKLVSSIRILRVYGPEPIRGTHAAGDILVRSDIELAFEECLLQSGPELFAELMNAGGPCVKSAKMEGERQQKECAAVNTLRCEIASMYERQCPSEDGLPKPPTLTSCLRRAFAARLHCHLSENYARMWELLSSPFYEDLDVCYACGCSRDEGKARMLLARLVTGTSEADCSDRDTAKGE